MSSTSSGVGLFFIVLFVLLIIFMPLVCIWCINTLFDVQNPYDLTHWFAALISGGVVFRRSGSD